MKHLLTFVLLLGALAAGAQDKIYVKTQRAPIEGEVTEVNTNDIKYKPTGRPYPVMTLERIDVLKIVYANGEVAVLNNPMKDFTMYSDQHRWNAKLNLFSPLNGHTQLFLEQAVKPGKSREFELNLIGLGNDPNLLDGYGYYGQQATYAPRGVGVGYGMRFIRMPDYVNGQARLRHLMQGSYIKPGVSLSYYTRNFGQPDPNTGYNTIVRKPVYAAAAHVTFGRQWILDNQFSIEIYGLAGLGLDNVRSTQSKLIRDVQPQYPYQTYYEDNSPYLGFGYTRFSKDNLGVVLGAGLRVGYLFDWKTPKPTVK